MSILSAKLFLTLSRRQSLPVALQEKLKKLQTMLLGPIKNNNAKAAAIMKSRFRFMALVTVTVLV